MSCGNQLTKEECLKRVKNLSVALVRDLFITPKVATSVLKCIKNIPKAKKAAQGICKLFKKCRATKQAANRVVGKGATKIAKKTGTVWDFIKTTDVMYKNTKLPRSFELSVGIKRLWVHPNATEHMFEYITKAKSISHGMPVNSQSLLNSFRASVAKAIKSGIQYTDKPIIIGSWELMFSPPRKEGLLPVIKHALYKPKGF